MRTILDDVATELRSTRYRTWAAMHRIDAGKVRMELAGNRRPLAGSPYARLLIEAIRVGLEWEQPPPPPAPSLAELGRNVMFTAQNPAAALRCPTHWKIAVSADPRFDAAVRAAAPRIKQAGHLLAVWGVQTQVGTERIRTLAADLAADYTIFQAETPAEYDTAIAAGARLIVGNPNSWTDAQRKDATVRAGSLLTLFEVYANVGSPFPDVASSRGVPISSEVLGVGPWRLPDGTDGQNLQLPDYRPHTPDGVWATISVFLAETMSDESWGLLP